jgi:SHS2 domain-containing protein
VHTWIEHTAEQELELEGESAEAVIAEAAEALAGLLGEPEPGPPVRRELTAAAPDLPALLAEWLNELVYLADEGFLTERVVALALSAGPGENENHSHQIRATVEGRPGTPRGLVKAVTYHRLQLEQEGVRWRGRIVLDV